jgi:tight adherence protein B
VSVGRSSDTQQLLRGSASGIPVLAKMLDRRNYSARWTDELERAGLSLRPGEYFLMRVIIAVVTLMFFALIGRSPLWFVVGACVGVVAFMVPAFWVRMRINRRVRAINAQLAETVTLIANGLRAGFAFAQGVDVATKRMGPPISTEFNRMLLDVNLGASTEEALRAMNERVGSEDMDMVITAILIQRNTGGNLAEVLESVTSTMRDRERIRGEINTLTASQRFTGWVLCAWPLVIALGFFAIAPSVTSLLWTTEAGRVLLAIWITLNVLGVYTIRRVLDIDI